MKTLAIVQARMGSSRLPGKVLMDLAGETVLQRVVRRLGRAALVNQVVVATSLSPMDDAVVSECNRLGVDHFRGSEADVLDRYYHCAQAFAARGHRIVTAFADCALSQWFDDITLEEVARYTKAAEQRRLAEAAIRRLGKQDGNENSQT